MTILDAVPTALGIAEDAILDALGLLEPPDSAAWDTHPPETVGRLTLPDTGAARLARLYTAQHQDGGGAPNPFIGARFWSGLVLVKCLARTDEDARAGIALAHTAMLALTAADGYRISARLERPVDLPREIVRARALLYRVTVRKVEEA